MIKKFCQKSLINLYELDPELKSQYEEQFLVLEGLRNFFGHGRYSLKRPSVLYQPNQNKRCINEILKAIMDVNYIPVEQFENLPLIWKPE